MYVPVYQGLTPLDFLRRPRPDAVCFPFDAPRRRYFYRARNAIYHLFRALCSTNARLTVLAPDYNSGNEVLAMLLWTYWDNDMVEAVSVIGLLYLDVCVVLSLVWRRYGFWDW